MPYKDKEREKAYQKAYQKAYRNAHREEHNARSRAWRQAHREEQKAYRNAHKEEINAKVKAWHQAHKEERNAYKKAYNKTDTNSFGQTKLSIRLRSRRYLFNTLKHSKLKNYEIHHCFGYDDYRNFIYIPKSLHLQIHQFLRDNAISADTDHYNKIVHLIIACEEYVYIKA